MKAKKEKLPEDRILGMVLTRLRMELNIGYEAISDWTKAQGDYMWPSSICELSQGHSTQHLSRIPLIARYFREVHGLDYVTTDYLLHGTTREQERVEREKEIATKIRNEEILPLFEIAEKEAV